MLIIVPFVFGLTFTIKDIILIYILIKKLANHRKSNWFALRYVPAYLFLTIIVSLFYSIFSVKFLIFSLLKTFND